MKKIMLMTISALFQPAAWAYSCGTLGLADSKLIYPSVAKKHVVQALDYKSLQNHIATQQPFIYIPLGTTIEIPNKAGALKLGANQTIFSSRNKTGESGGLRISPNQTLSEDEYAVITLATGARLSGLTITGPDSSPSTHKKTIGIQTLPNSRGVVIDNSELYAWPWAAISIKQSTEAIVRSNYIHNNIKAGLGYGVVVQNGDATANISCNIFDANRHAIAGAGQPGEGYDAAYNLVMQGGGRDAYHQFDMHAGGTGAGGAFVRIINNWFNFGDYGTSNRSSAMIRGIPTEGAAIIEHNVVKSDFQITSTTQAFTGVAGSLASSEQLTQKNTFGAQFIFHGDTVNGCFMSVSGENISVLCKAVGIY